MNASMDKENKTADLPKEIGGCVLIMSMRYCSARSTSLPSGPETYSIGPCGTAFTTFR